MDYFLHCCTLRNKKIDVKAPAQAAGSRTGMFGWKKKCPSIGPVHAELGKITQAVLLNLLLLLFCGVWGVSVLSSSSLERENAILRAAGQFSGRISPVLFLDSALE